jgi:SAM-dependent methyltransferase
MIKKLFKRKQSNPEDKERVAKIFDLKTSSYLNEKGEFDYNRYKEIQIQGNRTKIENVWVIEDNIKYLSNYIKSWIKEPTFGLCHGTRRGMEQGWFSKYLGCEVLGTEISDTASEFPNTIEWDFHEVKNEWIGNVDFIYSNSFDHSYNPAECIKSWMSCLKPGGICIIEHSDYHGVKGVDDLDPFGAELLIMPYLILEWSEGKFAVREILKAPKKGDAIQQLNFLVIRNN